MTTLAADLAEHGIRLRSYASGEHRTICPQCSAGRKKKTDPCLAVKIDDDSGATWNCHHCDTRGNIPGQSVRRERERELSDQPRREPKKRPAPILPAPETNPEKPQTMYDWFSKRGISRDVVDRFGCYVTSHWIPATEKEERCIVFPYVRAGILVNRKYRDKDKNFAQDKGAARTLFNIDALAGHDTAIIVEGEPDVLACAQAGIFNVVTLPDGAPKKARDEMDPDDKRYEALRNCEAELSCIKRFIIAGDNDAAGLAHREEIARRLGKERCWSVEWPALNDAPRKDANEVLMADGPEILRECIETAVPFPIAGLYEAGDYFDAVDKLFGEGRQAGLSTGWAGVDEYLTLRGGDMTILTGIPNHGKSEWLDALMVNLARLHGWRFSLCSFENDPAEHISKLAEKYAHAPFWDGPTARMTRVILDGAKEWIRKHFFFIRADDESPSLDWILDRAKAAVMRHGIRGLVIDPWNEIDHMRPDRLSETEYISQSLGRLRRFARVNGLHVWIVAHPSKLYRDKDGHVPVPGLYDISGSAHWANKADFGITVHLPEGPMTPLVELHITKVRHKWLGKRGTVKLRYMAATGEYSDDLEALAE